MQLTTEQNELTDIELTEVSCVKRGANPGARILLAKADDIPPRYVIHKGVRYDTEMSLTSRIEAVGEALQQKYGSMEVYVRVCAVFDDAVIFRLNYSDGTLYRASYTHDAAKDSTVIGDKVPVKVVYEDTAESAEKALKGAQKMEVTQTQPDAISKALADQSAEFQKKLDEATSSFQKQLDTERQRSEAAETEVRKERDTRILNEYTEIAKTRFSHVPTDKTKLGALLKSVHEKLTAEEAEAVEKILDAANGQAKMLTQSTGELYTQTVDESTATGQLRTMAKARAERDKIEFGKALADVSRENPKLYQQARDERAKGVQ